ncbi:MAG: hypothetical protein JXR46_06140 [Calditrichaceae bacterium]|nr:hypothetical protein [Calditrichaceae bacterium]MBN2708606.1 hypothetical protein [Calditrichaceae bacterium]RQV95457.1 MAG: hypothetical protein EH224_07505 [Calditrichota bacterium]
MKLKNLIVLMICITFFGITNAQKLNNEISLGYGLGDYFEGFAEALTVLSSFGTYSEKKVTSTGPVFLGYERPATNRIYYGILAGYYSAKFLIRERGFSSGDIIAEYHHERTYFMFNLTTRYNYYNGDSFILYSRIGAGLNAYNSDIELITGDRNSELKKPQSIALNLDLLGFRIGKRLQFFGEISISSVAPSFIKTGLAFKF